MTEKTPARRQASGVPTGKLARTTVAGVTAAKIGAKKLGLMSKRPFLSSQSYENEKARSEDDVARVLFEGLTKLRGTALKIAQIMSLELGVLPEAYRKELYKSHYQVPPLNRAVIRRLMISEFGRPPEEVFESFEPEAFAAASLGQVHRATTREGTRVAVKVQYPGIGGALKNDLEMVKQFFLPFLKSEYLGDALAEIDRRLTEEIDYKLELENTAWFHAHAQRPGVVLPRTFASYSTELVLSTELLDGAHIAKWLQTQPSQEQRDHAAQTIYDFFVHSVFESHLSRMHADPNPGNYLFREDGTVAVVDFGSIKRLDPEFCKQVAEIWRCHIRRDHKRACEIYAQFGMAKGDLKRTREFFMKALAPFGDWLGLPFSEDTFDFGRHPEFCEQGAKNARELVTLRELDGFTTETVIFDRNIYGLFRIFTELKARVRMKNEWIY